MKAFKKVLIAIITNNQEDLCTVADITRDYTKTYRIGVLNDKKESLVTLYITKWKIKRLIRKLNDRGYELTERSNYIYEVKKS